MRVMKVQGRGRVSMAPDLAAISFDVTARATACAECLAELNRRVDELRESMGASGVDRAELKTVSFNVKTETENKGDRSVFAGYSATHNLRIELPMDRELMNRVLRLVARGQSRAEIKIAFLVKDKEEARRRILAEAVRVARTNAETLAGSAGVKLGKLQQIGHSLAEGRFYEAQESVLEAGAPSKGEVDIEPQDVGAEDSVTLVYEIMD